MGPGPLLDTVTGWLLFAALLGATGAVALRVVVLPRLAHGGEALAVEAARFGSWVALALPAAFALVFWRQLAEFRDPFVPWTEDAHLLLTGTDWGRTFLIGAALALLVPAAFALTRSVGTVGWLATAPMVAALGVFPALTGHANAGAGTLRAATVAADTLHVWAAGAWIGGLACLLYVDRRRRRVVGAAGPLPALVHAFSPLAVASVAVLVVTGVFASWVQVPDVPSLTGSAYGRTLLFKLLAVGAVLGLGARNWKRLTPRLGESDGPSSLRRWAAVELVIAQVVLAVTAVLVRTSPTG